MHVKTTFQYKQYDITTTGIVLNEDTVEDIQWTVHNVDNEDEITEDMIDCITDSAKNYLIDKAYYPDLEFMKIAKDEVYD